MSDEYVSIEAVCKVSDCRHTEIFAGPSAESARRKAWLAGWRDTPDHDPTFGLCPEHAAKILAIQRSAETE